MRAMLQRAKELPPKMLALSVLYCIPPVSFHCCHSGMFSSSGWGFHKCEWYSPVMCLMLHICCYVEWRHFWWGQLLHTEYLGSAVLSCCSCFHPSRNVSIPLLLQFLRTEIPGARCRHHNTCYDAFSTLFLVLSRCRSLRSAVSLSTSYLFLGISV